MVGADGIRSTVAGAVGAPIERAGDRRDRLVYGYWSGLDADGYEWIFRPDACAGVIPTNDGQACVFAAAPPDRGSAAAASARASRTSSPKPRPTLAAAARRRDRAAGGVRTFAGRPGYIRRPWGPGWALVGDAGYWKDPISAHGLTDALRDAELLARGHRRGAAGRPPERSAFDEYHRDPRPRLAAAVRRRRHDRRDAVDRGRDPRG